MESSGCRRTRALAFHPNGGARVKRGSRHAPRGEQGQALDLSVGPATRCCVVRAEVPQTPRRNVGQGVSNLQADGAQVQPPYGIVRCLLRALRDGGRCPTAIWSGWALR